MMRTKWGVLVILPVLLILSACGGMGVVGSALSIEGAWTLQTLDGAPMLPDSSITATFTDELITGFSGCNSYGGGYTARGRSLSFDEIAMTLMACLDEGVMEQERAYMEALSSVTQFRLEDDRLALLDESGATLLVYVRLETFTGDPAALMGTSWQLSTLDGSSLDETLPFTLAFTENRYSGLAGCRHFEGDYQAGDGEIQFSSMTMVEENCPGADDMYWAAEGRFTDALSEARHWRISENQLEIRTVRGELLHFIPYTPETGIALEGTSWMLTAFLENETMTPPLDATEITLAFEEGNAAGSGGCNSYGGAYSVEGNALRIGPVISTKMYCTSPEGVVEQETRFTDILANVARFEGAENRLTLTTADGRGLVFTAQR
jgi:heat shock protein HslJ